MTQGNSSSVDWEETGGSTGTDTGMPRTTMVKILSENQNSAALQFTLLCSIRPVHMTEIYITIKSLIKLYKCKLFGFDTSVHDID